MILRGVHKLSNDLGGRHFEILGAAKMKMSTFHTTADTSLAPRYEIQPRGVSWRPVFAHLYTS